MILEKMEDVKIQQKTKKRLQRIEKTKSEQGDKF